MTYTVDWQVKGKWLTAGFDNETTARGFAEVLRRLGADVVRTSFP